ncbi:hypothetical protein [Streptomyces noursei]|uniref:hypothetical protein n=1 Tax=Streptomyces noursei TaxID=1971 RepID=UPI0023B783E2|nr:hypothetical protein [Streptomyces noursei]
MDRTHDHQATTAVLLAEAATVIDANPHMSPTATVGPRLAEGLLALTARHLYGVTALARAHRVATRSHLCTTTNHGGTTAATVAQTLLETAESAAIKLVAAALAALGPVPTDTTRAQLAAAMRVAANEPFPTSVSGVAR